MPTAITARHRAMSERLWARFSDSRTVTVRKLSNLTNPGSAPPVANILVRGATLAGAATIDLDSTALRGTLAWGAKFTITGVSGTYTTTAATLAATNILNDVPITPVLAGNAADNAPVTITQEYGAFTFRALRTRLEDEDDEAVMKDWQKYHLLVHADGVVPAINDLLYDGSDTDYIVRVRPVAPAGSASRFIVYTGRSPASG